MQHNDVMKSLKSKLSQLIASIEHQNVIYIDYPVHHNVGDLLIYLGAIKLLKENNKKIVCQMSALNVNAFSLKKLIDKYKGKVSIILHGGGNLGDIYSLHQQCRLNIISSFPDTNTIIFPQTIFYTKKENLKRDAAVFSKHKNLTLFVRDEKSEELAKTMCTSVQLCPDTAHMLWEEETFLGTTKRKGYGKLKFRRRDVESSFRSEGAFDWQDIITKHDETFKKVIRKLILLNKTIWIQKLLSQLWVAHSQHLCKKAAEKFYNYSEIETDRLHGHILSCLLEIDNYVLDNSYGKNSSYIRYWTSESPIVELSTCKD